MIASAVLASSVLADSGNGPGAGLGLIVFLVLLVACLFLFRSMSGRIKRLPASFDVPSDNGKGNGKDADKAVSSPDVVDLP